jgi:hypothetical protein
MAVSAYPGGGFPELPVAMLIVTSGLAIVAMWMWVKRIPGGIQHRRFSDRLWACSQGE